MVYDLSVSECEELLRHERVGRLAVREAEGAYIVPITYAFGDGAIYGHAPMGKKISLMRLWPHVAFQVDTVQNLSTWRSVLIRGRFEEISDDALAFRARALLVRASGGSLWGATAGHGHAISLADAVLFRIRIDEITGRAQNS
ncbi:MAG: pyridoxamine 5'-phosphate oxidase family protein [Dehalococcoidia bacterium]